MSKKFQSLQHSFKFLISLVLAYRHHICKPGVTKSPSFSMNSKETADDINSSLSFII